jgi:hypothetical protein
VTDICQQNHLSSYVPDAPFLSSTDFFKKYSPNNGNFVFCHALSQILNCSPVAINWHTYSKEKYPDIEVLVLPLANHLGSHADLGNLAKLFEKIDIPMIGVNLGIQSPLGSVEPKGIPDGTWHWFEQLAKHSQGNIPNISLRGKDTYNFIAKRNMQQHCVVTGCPSNFINPSVTLGEDISKKVIPDNPRFAIAAGNPFLGNFSQIEQSFIDLVNKTHGLYVCQHPEALIQLSRGESHDVPEDRIAQAKRYMMPNLSTADFINWFRSNSHVFFSVPEWMETLKRFDVVVGTRIHGTLIGIQAGVPSLCVCVDARTLELCQTMHIPHVDARAYPNGMPQEDIITILREWDWKKYDTTRKELATVLRKLFESNGIAVAEYFRKIAS